MSDATLAAWEALAPPPPAEPPPPPAPKANPCLALFGPGPEGRECRECIHMYGVRHANTYWKCDQRENTGGAATDHRRTWPACGRFVAKEGA